MHNLQKMEYTCTIIENSVIQFTNLQKMEYINYFFYNIQILRML